MASINKEGKTPKPILWGLLNIYALSKGNKEDALTIQAPFTTCLQLGWERLQQSPYVSHYEPSPPPVKFKTWLIFFNEYK